MTNTDYQHIKTVVLAFYRGERMEGLDIEPAIELCLIERDEDGDLFLTVEGEDRAHEWDSPNQAVESQ